MPRSSADRQAKLAGHGIFTTLRNEILRISASTRRLSDQFGLIKGFQSLAPADIAIGVFDKIGDLPIFPLDLAEMPQKASAA